MHAYNQPREIGLCKYNVNDIIYVTQIVCTLKGLFTLNAKMWPNNAFKSKQYIPMGLFTPGAIIRGAKKESLVSEN